MIDGKSSGVSTSQIKKERFFDKIAIINLYGKFCTKMDTVLSACLNQQLQMDDLVAQCVSKVIDVAAHSQLFPGLYEHNFHDFTFLPFKLHFCIYNLHFSSQGNKTMIKSHAI